MSELLEFEHSQKNWKVRPFANGRARPFANGRTFMGEPPWPQFQLDIFTRLGTVFLLIVTKSSVCNRQTLGPWSSVRTTVFCHQSRKYPKYRISNWTAGQIAHQPLELTILSTKVSKLIGHLYLFRRFLIYIIIAFSRKSKDCPDFCLPPWPVQVQTLSGLCPGIILIIDKGTAKNIFGKKPKSIFLEFI